MTYMHVPGPPVSPDQKEFMYKEMENLATRLDLDQRILTIVGFDRDHEALGGILKDVVRLGFQPLVMPEPKDHLPIPVEILLRTGGMVILLGALKPERENVLIGFFGSLAVQERACLVGVVQDHVSLFEPRAGILREWGGIVSHPANVFQSLARWCTRDEMRRGR